MSMIVRLKLVVLLATSFLVFSCNSKENDNKEKLISSQERKIKDLEKRLSEIEEKKEASSVTEPEEVYVPITQYYFVVLNVSEQHGLREQSFYFTTEVNEVTGYNETMKFRLLDAVVSNYKNSAGAMVYSGTVTKRQIFLFNSYAEASKSREKYILR